MVIFVPEMEKKTLGYILFVSLLFCYTASIAQRGNTAWTKYRHEASIGYGMNSVFSGLGERDSPVFNTVFQRSTFNASYRYFVFKNFAARGSFTHAFARKNDKEILDEGRQNVRLDYQSTITEFAAMAEYHLIDETTKGRRGKVRRARGGMSNGLNLGVSFFAGVGITYFRPYAEYFGKEVILRPISDPIPVNNRAEYKKTRLHFPVGAQVRIIATENWRVGFEAGYRLGLSDYMDYVSGAYYRNPEDEVIDQFAEDPQYLGNVTFSKDQAPVSQLVSESGKRNFFFGLLTLSYRFKS
ncbi:MAG: hypothetical protein WEC59_12475 [Salibacteraceae bacterium]